MKEMWRPIPGSRGIYEASTLGRIRSTDHMVRQLSRWGRPMTRLQRGRILAPAQDKDGYLYVCVRGLGGNKRVHRLVAKAFIKNPKRKPQINHKNGRVADNRPSNLEWVTNSENHLHAVHQLGRKPNTQKAIPVMLTSPLGVTRRFSGTTEAAGFLGVVRTAVANAIRQGSKTKGYKAQYVDES